MGDRPVHGSLLIETRPAGPDDAGGVLEVILARDLADVGELWRRTGAAGGLGRALLLTSMRAFRERNLPRAALSVHDDLLATRLYESAGMRPAWRHDRFEKGAASTGPSGRSR